MPAGPLSPPVQKLADLIEKQPGDSDARVRSARARESPRSGGRGRHTSLSRLGMVLFELLDAAIAACNCVFPRRARRSPINALLLDYPMCVPSGFTFFQFPIVNEIIREILDTYKTFLDSPESREHLTEEPVTGWFGPDAKKRSTCKFCLCLRSIPTLLLVFKIMERILYPSPSPRRTANRVTKRPERPRLRLRITTVSHTTQRQTLRQILAQIATLFPLTLTGPER